MALFGDSGGPFWSRLQYLKMIDTFMEWLRRSATAVWVEMDCCQRAVFALGRLAVERCGGRMRLGRQRGLGQPAQAPLDAAGYEVPMGQALRI